MNHRQKNFISTGTASILLIFVLLCLLTFSVLSIVSAKANEKVSLKNAERTTAYYKAENRANDVLYKISDCLSSTAKTTDETLFFQIVRQQLNGSDGITFPDVDTLTYHVPVTDSQDLFVSLSLSYQPLENGTHYQIDAWNVESTHEWENDTSIPVLGSDSMPDLSTEE